jgi:hypothetical protein
MSVSTNRSAVHPVLLWRMTHEGHDAECVMEHTPAGLQARLLVNGQMLVAYQFSGHAEVLAWAAEKYADLGARGWAPRDLQVQARATESRLQKDPAARGSWPPADRRPMRSVA